MKDGQNGQSDQMPSQPEVTATPLSIGWGNNRSITQIEVREIGDMLLIETSIIGLDPASLIVTIQAPYFIVEGTIARSGGRGRYARHVPELVHVREDVVDVSYDVSGELVLRLMLKNGGQDAAP
jgi:hypothetical protein